MIGLTPNKGVYNLLFLGGGSRIFHIIGKVDTNINIALESRFYMWHLFLGIPPTPCTAVPPFPGVKTKKIGRRCISRGEWGLGGGHTAEGGNQTFKSYQRDGARTRMAL